MKEPTKWRVLIVDDEPLARTGMSDYVSRVDFLMEVGQARDGMAALKLMQRERVDLLLLDVQMPGLTGVELVQSLRHPPAIIFTTAHPGFAIDGFDLNAVDYLLKPITFPRFLKAALKANDRLSSPENASAKLGLAPLAQSPTATPTALQPDPSSTAAEAASENQLRPVSTTDLFIKEEGRVERVAINTILYAESMQNYCRIHTTGKVYLPLLPMKELEEALPEADFFRIHRSFLVRLAAVEAIVDHQVRIGKQLLPISRANRSALEERLTGGRLL